MKCDMYQAKKICSGSKLGLGFKTFVSCTFKENKWQGSKATQCRKELL